MDTRPTLQTSTGTTPGGIFYRQLRTATSRGNLVLANGYGCSSFSWPKPFLEKLAERYILTVFDHLGTGKTANPPVGSLSVPWMSLALHDVVSFLELKDIALLGWSLGGLVALQYADFFSDNVAQLVVLSSTAGGVNYVAPEDAVLQGLIKPAGTTPIDKFLNAHLPLFANEAEAIRHKDDVLAILGQIASAPTAPEGYMNHFLAYKGALKSPPPLSNIQMPRLVVHGDSDRLLPIDNGRRLGAALGVETVILPGAHLLQVTHADALAQAITDFLG